MVNKFSTHVVMFCVLIQPSWHLSPWNQIGKKTKYDELNQGFEWGDYNKYTHNIGLGDWSFFIYCKIKKQCCRISREYKNGYLVNYGKFDKIYHELKSFFTLFSANFFSSYALLFMKHLAIKEAKKKKKRKKETLSTNIEYRFYPSIGLLVCIASRKYLSWVDFSVWSR